MTWKTILKYKRKSSRLLRYMSYAQANRHNIHDLMTMEQFAERVHMRLKSLGGTFAVARLIEEEVFDEINQLDKNDPNMPFDIPFSYEEYMEKYGEEILERQEADRDFLRRREEQVQRKRAERERKLREKRSKSEYWEKYGPKPLRSPQNEEE